MVNIEKLDNPFIKVIWEDNPENFTQEKIKRFTSYFKRKYNSDRVNIVTRVNGLENSTTSHRITENVLDPNYQKSLLKEFLKEHEIEVSWEKLMKLDSRVEEQVHSEDISQHQKWFVKWIEFKNFLSFGENNRIDFTNYNGITAIDSIPSNFGGKTTLTVDLLLFLFFNVTTKSNKAIEVFNRFTDKNIVLVKGEVEIDGDSYIIERGIIRKLTKKGEWSVRTELNLSKRLHEGTLQNLQGEQRRETEEFLKKAIGTMDDFLLTILTTANNLEDLLEAKPTYRGQVLTRFIGLEHLRKKEDACKEIYSNWNKKLISNHYNVEELKSTNENIRSEIKEFKKKIENNKKEINNLEDRHQKGVEYKESLISQKHTNINPDLVKVNPVTLQSQIDDCNNSIVLTTTKLERFEINEPNISYKENEHKKIEKEITTLQIEEQITKNKVEELKELITTLKEGEICPTCKRKLEDIDHTVEIEKQTKEVKEFLDTLVGLSITKQKKTEKNIEFSEIEIEWEEYERNKLRRIKTSLELKEFGLDLKQKTTILKEWETNKSKLEENQEIEKKLIAARTVVETLVSERDNLKISIAEDKSSITHLEDKITENKGRVEEIKKEEEVDKIFKAYLISYGKNGISKLILRNTIPYLNSELNRLLSDSCEFTLQLRINDRNELEFWMIDNGTGIEKLMSSGSGYEKTIASLALRAVLSKVCALPKPNIVCFDESFAKVSDENLDLVGKFFTKIKDYFERIFVISHNPLIKEWCDQTITVKKEKNISSII
jgi:DNA repair exonuclease SbcCD ATPase subunit